MVENESDMSSEEEDDEMLSYNDNQGEWSVGEESDEVNNDIDDTFFVVESSI